MFKNITKAKEFFMKLKKLSHVVIFCLGVMSTFFAISGGLAFLEERLFPDVKSVTNQYCSYLINGLIMSLVGVLALKKLGKINILKIKGKGFWHGVLLGSIMLLPGIYSAFTCIMYILERKPELQPLSVIITIVCMFLISVGFLEELIYRGIILGVLDDYFGHKSASAVWKTVILSGIFFGIFHFGNLSKGVSFLPVLSQAIDAVGIGIFWGAVYMRSRNLYSMVFLHAISDIFSALWLFIAGISMWDAFSSLQVNFVITFIMLIIHISLAIFLFRKKKMAEIINFQPNKLNLEPKSS